MCDYSLSGQQTRLARAGEDLVTHRFPTGTIGLASPADLETGGRSAGCRQGRWKHIFAEIFRPARVVRAVCVPPGARLIVYGFSRELQDSFGCEETEEVIFDQLSPASLGHRDCIRLRNGKLLLLQGLSPGQRVHVLSIESNAEPYTEPETLEARLHRLR